MLFRTLPLLAAFAPLIGISVAYWIGALFMQLWFITLFLAWRRAGFRVAVS